MTSTILYGKFNYITKRKYKYKPSLKVTKNQRRINQARANIKSPALTSYTSKCTRHRSKML